MKLTKLFGYIIIMAICSNVIYSQTKVTLRDAITSAYKNNPAIQKNLDLIESEDYYIHTAYGNLFPTLSFSTGYQRTNQVGTLTTNVNGVPVNTGIGTNQTYNNYNMTLRSDVTLFNGFNNYDQINIDKAIRTRYIILNEASKQDIVVKILSDYTTILKNQKIVQVDSATLEDSRAQLEAIKIFVEVGTKTQSDIYKQDVVVAQNELATEQARNNLDKSIADLAFDSNLPQNRTYTVDSTEFNVNISNDELERYVETHSDPDPLINTALRNRNDYRASLQNISVLQSNVELARSSLLFPTLTGFGTYQMSAQNIKDLTNSRVFTLGLTLTYQIFEGFSVENQREQAIINVRSANEDVKLIRDQIAVNIKKAQLDLKSLVKQIVITDRSLRSAEQDRITAQELYNVGRGTLLEVNTAATNYNNALINKLTLIYNFIFAQKQLEYYQGLLKY